MPSGSSTENPAWPLRCRAAGATGRYTGGPRDGRIVQGALENSTRQEMHDQPCEEPERQVPSQAFAAFRRTNSSLTIAEPCPDVFTERVTSNRVEEGNTLNHKEIGDPPEPEPCSPVHRSGWSFGFVCHTA